MKFLELYEDIMGEGKQKKFRIKKEKYYYDPKLNGNKDYDDLSDDDKVGLVDIDGEQIYRLKKSLDQPEYQIK